MNNQEIAVILDKILELMETGLDEIAYEEIAYLKSTLEEE